MATHKQRLVTLKIRAAQAVVRGSSTRAGSALVSATVMTTGIGQDADKNKDKIQKVGTNPKVRQVKPPPQVSLYKMEARYYYSQKWVKITRVIINDEPTAHKEESHPPPADDIIVDLRGIIFVQFRQMMPF